MTTSPPLPPAAPRDPDEPVRVRVRDPGDLVAALPALLGYHATRSIVLVALGGRPCVVRVTMRLDLPDRGGDAVWSAIAETFARGTSRVDAAEAVLIVLDGDEAECAELVPRLRTALSGQGVSLVDTILVREGRYRSYSCSDTQCCPPDGLPVPESSALVAAVVAEGTVIRADRDDLAAEVAEPEEAAAARARVVSALLESTAAHGSVGMEDDDMRRLLEQTCEDAAVGALRMDDAVRLTLLLRIGDLRDIAYAHMLTVGAQPHRMLWTAVCRQVPRDMAAAPLALAALSAYLSGAGALATEAIARAVAVDPRHATVRLVEDLMAAAITPGVVREALACSVLHDG